MTNAREEMFRNLITSAEAHHAESQRLSADGTGGDEWRKFYAAMTDIVAMQRRLSSAR